MKNSKSRDDLGHADCAGGRGGGGAGGENVSTLLRGANLTPHHSRMKSITAAVGSKLSEEQEERLNVLQYAVRRVPV